MSSSHPDARHRGRTSLFLRLLALVLLPGAILVAGCGDDDEPEPTATAAVTGTAAAASATPQVELEGELVVFAASSLTDAFGEMEAAFEDEYPDVDVTFNFASSSALATQINEGAPSDVFASANSAQMRVVSDAGNANPQAIFVTNLPVVITPADNDTIREFADLAEPGYSLVLAAEDVPIGQYAREIFTNASTTGGLGADFSEKVLANLQSNEANVRAVLTKVQLGEADAGVVYTTDAATIANDLNTIDIPAEFNVIAQYPIATLKEAGNPDAAQAFVDFVLSEAGQAIMEDWGFGGPAGTTNSTASLEISGLVDNELTLTVDSLGKEEQKTVTATNRDGQEVEYTGVSLAQILEDAGVKDSAREIVFTGSDGYAQTVTLDVIEADSDAIIALTDDGNMRNILPSQASRMWVSGLVSMTVQ